MSKLIRKDEANDAAIYSRDLREYVVPVRVLNKLNTFDEPKEQNADYDDILRVMFNRCAAALSGGGAMCVFCGCKDLCNKMRTVYQNKSEG